MSNEAIKLSDLIDSNPIGSLQIRVAVICFFLAMVDGFDAMSIAYVAPVIAKEFALTPEIMGQLISSALAGLMIGAFLGGPLADKFGRKPIIIASALIMGVFSLLTAISSGTTELFLYRFLTGLGLGAVMPNINILTAEFAPARRRALLMTAMYAGLPLGTIVGGLVSAILIENMGWQSVFVVGGVIPILLAPILYYHLPESPYFLAYKKGSSASLAKIVNAIAPQSKATSSTPIAVDTPAESAGVRALFAPDRRVVTILLWLTFFANLLTLNAIIGWLPSLLSAAGFPLDRAILTTILFSAGGIIGGLTIAAAIDRYGAIPTMKVSYVAAMIAVAFVGQVTAFLPLLMVALFLAGAATMGSQFGLNAVASSSYDTGSRATGLGWALAMGRLGGIAGPIFVGAAMAASVSLPNLFILGAVPMLFSAACVFLLGRQQIRS